STKAGLFAELLEELLGFGDIGIAIQRRYQQRSFSGLAGDLDELFAVVAFLADDGYCYAGSTHLRHEGTGVEVIARSIDDFRVVRLDLGDQGAELAIFDVVFIFADDVQVELLGSVLEAARQGLAKIVL